MCTSLTQPRNKRRALLFISWALVVLCMAVIFFLSSEPSSESQSRSDGVIAALLSHFGVELSSHFVRKAAHALEYCGLSLLLYGAYFVSFRAPQPTLSFLSAALYAVSDEAHQYFVPGRACQLRDVFVDSVGAAAGVLFCMAIFFLLHRISKKERYKNGNC